jgi:26S proteasome regulatory subunit N12
VSEFHATLESFSELEHVQKSPAVGHAVGIEQNLMEGAYNKVYAARKEVPTEEFTFFMDILISTIR